MVELDGAVDDLLLKDGQQAHAAGGGGDELELLGRVDGALAAQRGAEEAEDQRGGAVHHLDRGAGHADEDVHGAGDGEGDALGALQGEGLGDELAEEDLEVGDGGEGEGDGDDVGVDGGVRGGSPAEAAPGAEDDLGDGGLADPAEGEARRG